MSKQQSLTDLEYANQKLKTKRDEFLEIMEELIPWDERCAVVAPYYPSGKRGRPTRGIETMLRMYLLANWFSLSDEGVEDAIYDSYAFRKFVQIEHQKSRVRSKVEYIFRILKQLFHYRKVRYRGLEKNRIHAFTLVACANLFMLAQSRWCMGDCDA